MKVRSGFVSLESMLPWFGRAIDKTNSQSIDSQISKIKKEL